MDTAELGDRIAALWTEGYTMAAIMMILTIDKITIHKVLNERGLI